MKLRDARLCINCDEVYEAAGVYGRCPACASEAFRLICEWIPTVAEFDMWVNERMGGEAATSTPSPLKERSVTRYEDYNTAG